MLKGVNRQVVEVSQPESVYFERVLFFVKPEFYGLGEAKLRSKADALIKDTSEPPSTKHKKRKESESNFMQSAELTGLLLILIGIIGFGFGWIGSLIKQFAIVNFKKTW